MKLKKISLKNIRSYENQEIEFPEGFFLLAGDVGSGKTSILLAIEYALFGLQPGQTGSALLRNNTQLGEVALEFEINGQTVLIERKLKRGKTVTNECSAITIDGNKRECSITELKSKIIKLLGYPSEFIKKNNLLYRYTVYTPQEQMKQIISEDFEVRLNILRHIFGIDKYKTIRENLTVIINRMKDEAKFIQGEIASLDLDKKILLSKSEIVSEMEKTIEEKSKALLNLIKLRKSIESDSIELEQKIKDKERLETELEKAKVLLGSKKDSLSILQKEYLMLEKNISENKEFFNESDLIEVVQKLDSNNKEIERIQSSYIDFLAQINSLQQRKSDELIKKERIFRIDMCPTCLQDVPIAHKHNILNESEQLISRLSKEIETIENKAKEFASSMQKLKSDKNNLEDRKVKLQILRSKIPELEKSKDKLIEIAKNKENFEKDLYILVGHIDSLKENILSYSRFSNMFKLKQEEMKKAFLE